MTEPTTEQATTYTVLFVDDEPNILRAIKRALFTMTLKSFGSYFLLGTHNLGDQ